MKKHRTHWQAAALFFDWLISAGILAISGTLPALINFFILIAVPESHKWEEEKASGKTSHWATWDLLGVLFAGYFSDRYGSKDLLAAVYLVRGLAYTLLIFAPGVGGIWAFAVIAGASWIATVPLTYSLTREIYGIKAMGTLSGVVTMSHQMGGAITVWLAGWVFDRYGTYTPFWVAGASLLAVASVLAFTIRERDLAARYQPPLLQQPQPIGAPAGGA